MRFTIYDRGHLESLFNQFKWSIEEENVPTRHWLFTEPNQVLQLDDHLGTLKTFLSKMEVSRLRAVCEYGQKNIGTFDESTHENELRQFPKMFERNEKFNIPLNTNTISYQISYLFLRPEKNTTQIDLYIRWLGKNYTFSFFERDTNWFRNPVGVFGTEATSRIVLDDLQLALTKGDESRTTLVQGVAGSGKSLIIQRRINELSTVQSQGNSGSEKEFLFVMYNNALAAKQATDLERMTFNQDGQKTKTKTISFYDWIREILPQLIKDKRDEWSEEIAEGHASAMTHSEKAVARSLKNDWKLAEFLQLKVQQEKSKAFEFITSNSDLNKKYHEHEKLFSELGFLSHLKMLRSDPGIPTELRELVKKAIRSIGSTTSSIVDYLNEFARLNSESWAADKKEHWDNYHRTLRHGTDRRLDKFDMVLAVFLIILRYGSLRDYWKTYGRKSEDRSDNNFPSLYRHIFIDEVQDFSKIHLIVATSLGYSPTGLTLVGDISQRIIEHDHGTWEKLKNTIQIDETEVASLQKVYRYHSQIGRLVEKFLRQDSQPEYFRNDGFKPKIHSTDDLNQYIALHVRQHTQNRKKFGEISLCVVFANQEQADAAEESFRASNHSNNAKICGCNTDETRKFRFDDRNGLSREIGEGFVRIYFADVFQIKGLEFDHIFIMDPDEDNFPFDGNTLDPDVRNLSKNRLYVAISRAREIVDFIVTKQERRLHCILKEALEEGLIDSHMVQIRAIS